MWVSPSVRETVIIDTASLSPDDSRFQHGDTFPEDAVLVIISPRENARLLEIAAKLPYPIGGATIAAAILDAKCDRDDDLRRRLRW